MAIKKDNNKLHVNMESYFSSNVYSCYIPDWVKDFNKSTNKYIREVRKENLSRIKKDFGTSHCSYSLIGDSDFFILSDFITSVSKDILAQQGYDLSRKKIKLNDFWVQEFSKQGGGHQAYHVHPNNHISGFYFLKCSDNTSFPLFEDPRPGKVMTDLRGINEDKITSSSNQIFYKPKPGTLIFFNSYLPHQFTVDRGIDPFRFIHFNLQAI